VLYAGDLRHSVRIQAYRQVSDGGGGTTKEWTDYANIRAHISPIAGREVTINGQIEARLSHRVTMRWLPGLEASMRVLFGSRPFNIRWIRNLDERNRWIELLCEEGVAD
jgi:SPP1 family predicted phage head-tail adaptor